MALKNARQNLFNSPEVAAKQQRINTLQKAPRTSSEIQTNLSFWVNDVVNSIQKIYECSRFESETLSDIGIFPAKCAVYDTYVLQRTANLHCDVANFALGSTKIQTPLSFYLIIWMMSLCGNNADSSAQPSFRSTIDAFFEKFADMFRLGKSSLKENRISFMKQADLAQLVMYLAWSNVGSEWLLERNCCDTVVNGLLTALSDKSKDPKDLSMAVACIAHLVHKHSSLSRVMTSGNSCQLVRLLLSKTVYPNENKSGKGRDTSSLQEQWEVLTCRMGLTRLLALEAVLCHTAVKLEVNNFCRKWWVRLHQAAVVISMSRPPATLSSSPHHQTPHTPVLLPTGSAANADASMSIPPAVRNALEVLSDLLTARYPAATATPSSDYSNKYAAVFESLPLGDKQVGGQLTPDVFLLSLAFGCKDDGEHMGITNLIHFIGSPIDPRAASSASSLSSAMLRHLRAALLEQRLQRDLDSYDAGSSPAKSHYHTLQTTAGIMAYDMFQQVLECTHKVSNGFRAVLARQKDGGTSTPLRSPKGSNVSSQSIPAGPFQRSLLSSASGKDRTTLSSGTPNNRRTPNSRPPLGVITNTAVRYDSVGSSSLSASKHTTPSQRRHFQTTAAGEDKKATWQRTAQEVAWEPVLIDYVFLLQECASLARLRERGTEGDSQGNLVRDRVAEWIQDVDTCGASVLVSPSRTDTDGHGKETAGGIILFNTLAALIQALETVQSSEDFDKRESSMIVIHRLSGAVVILLGLLSCVANMEYKCSMHRSTDGCAEERVAGFKCRDDDDVVCFDEPLATSRRVGPCESQGSAVTVSPQEALVHRQRELLDLLAPFIRENHLVIEHALEICYRSRAEALDAEGSREFFCGCSRCWCTDTQWPPSFWNEGHIQRMISLCNQVPSPKVESPQMMSTQGTLLDEEDATQERYSDAMLGASPALLSSIRGRGSRSVDYRDVSDGQGDEQYHEDEDPTSRLSMSSLATADSIELPPPPPLTASFDSQQTVDGIDRTLEAEQGRGVDFEDADDEGVDGDVSEDDLEVEEAGEDHSDDDTCASLNCMTQSDRRVLPLKSGGDRSDNDLYAVVPISTTCESSASMPSSGSGNEYSAVVTIPSDRREITRMSTELSKMRMTCAKETMAKEEEQRRLATTSENLLKEQQRVRVLEEQLRQKETENACMQAREASLMEENQRIQIELADVKMELSGARHERDECEERCRSVEGMLEEAWAKMKVLAQSEDTCRKKVDRSEHQVEKCRDEFVELERRLTVLNGDLRASFALSERLKADVTSLRASNNQLELDVTASREETEIYMCSAKALESQMTCLEEDLMKVQQRNHDMEAFAETHRTELAVQRKETERLRAAVAEMERTCDVLRVKVKESADETLALKAENEEQRNHMEHQLTNLTKEATRECERLHDIISDVRSQKEAIQSDLTSEMSRSCKLGKNLDKQVLLSENLQSELNAIQEEKHGLLEDLSAKQSECDALNADLVKHKELISYINKLSTEAEARRNK